MEWQPIETAPRTMEPFLAFGSYTYPEDKWPTIYTEIARYSGDEKFPWETWEGKAPNEVFSHWMPLPNPPSPSGKHYNSSEA